MSKFDDFEDKALKVASGIAPHVAKIAATVVGAKLGHPHVGSAAGSAAKEFLKQNEDMRDAVGIGLLNVLTPGSMFGLRAAIRKRQP